MEVFVYSLMTKKEVKYLINIALLFTVAVSLFMMKVLPHKSPAPPDKSGLYYVTKTIDGDTIKLSSGDHVRLIGIDTPESRYNSKLERDVRRSHKDMALIIRMGKMASAFTRDLVQGKKVRLEFDVEKRDRYGRLLAYVYLEDGTFVNAKIIEEGYAQAMTIPPNVRFADLFVRLQKEARTKGRGLWENTADKSLF